MLLDACIVIDVLRGKDAALAFGTGLAETPALTVTELVAGCRNVKEGRQIDRLLSHYVLHDIGRDIASLAGDYTPLTPRRENWRGGLCGSCL